MKGLFLSASPSSHGPAYQSLIPRRKEGVGPLFSDMYDFVDAKFSGKSSFQNMDQ